MSTRTHLLKTGIDGLDSILCGGLPAVRMYLVQGDPGAGKTTMSLQFLREGVAQGEATLYVTLSETRQELMAVAASHGWNVDGIDIYEMSIGDDTDLPDEENTLYLPAEVELGERMSALLARVDLIKPTRMILDSCSLLRLLAQTPLGFRRLLLALKQELVRRSCTALLLDSPTTPQGDVLLQSLVHGVVQLDLHSPKYGVERRRLRIQKLREVPFYGGYHDFAITTGGLVVYPRLVASEHHETFDAELLSSGISNLDTLLGGGLEPGTNTLFLGPAGSGKSTLSTQFAVAAAERGEHVAMFISDEGTGTLLSRAEALGMGLRGHLDARRVTLEQHNPAEMSPGEFVQAVRDAVNLRGARMIVIDSLNGYLHAMPEEEYLVLQLHELLTFLRQHGVVTLLTSSQRGFVPSATPPVDVSYLADTVVLLSYFEAAGRVRKALSVVKKRAGAHEDTIREFSMGPGGFQFGPPLEEFVGVMTGTPEFLGDVGEAGPLLEDPSA